MLKRLKIARHVAVEEGDPHTRIDGKPAVLPSEHVGGGRGVEQASESEPADHAAADPLGEGGQIGRGDRPGRHEQRRAVTARFVGSRLEDAVGHAGVEVHVMVERRAEAMQEGDGAESRAGGRGCVGSRVDTGGREQQPLDLSKKDLRERCDGLGAVGEHTAQSLRHRNHPLPYGDRRNNVIGEVCGGLCHVATVAGWADAPSLAGESDDEPLAAARAQSAGESQAEDAACEVAAEFLADGAGTGRSAWTRDSSQVSRFSETTL
jgi:hypothetical protein